MGKIISQCKKRSAGARAALVVVLVGAAMVLSSTAPSSASVTSNQIAGRKYAASLFAKIPIPSGLKGLAEPLKPLRPVVGSLGYTNVASLTRYYSASTSVNVLDFVKKSFPVSDWRGTGSTYDGGPRTSVRFVASSLCTDRHVAYCGVTYSVEALTKSQEELRIDVSVVWTPIHVVKLPSSGVVTLSGYNTISLTNPSSGLVRVQLNPRQAMRLRSAVALLRSSPGGACMEDSTLFRIAVASTTNGKPTWSAVADECPGQLIVTAFGRRVALNARSCSFERLVGTFFPPHTAIGTKAGLKACASSG
jgi:hypothetical protein